MTLAAKGRCLHLLCHARAKRLLEAKHLDSVTTNPRPNHAVLLATGRSRVADLVTKRTAGRSDRSGVQGRRRPRVAQDTPTGHAPES